jgi:hypothetical protein
MSFTEAWRGLELAADGNKALSDALDAVAFELSRRKARIFELDAAAPAPAAVPPATTAEPPTEDLVEFITRTMLNHDDWCRTKIGMQPYTRDDRNPSWRSAKQAREIEGRHLAEALAGLAGSAVPAVPPDTQRQSGDPIYSEAPSDADIALAWHDVTCPEGQDCRDRLIHSLGASLVNSGVLHRFLEALNEHGYVRPAAVPDPPSAPDEARADG